MGYIYTCTFNMQKKNEYVLSFEIWQGSNIKVYYFAS